MTDDQIKAVRNLVLEMMNGYGNHSQAQANRERRAVKKMIKALTDKVPSKDELDDCCDV